MQLNPCAHSFAKVEMLPIENPKDIGGNNFNRLSNFGFRFGRNGAHSARTIMFDEVGLLFERLPVDASRSDYVREIVELNALSKRTKKSRELTLRHLVSLYALTPDVPIFRVFRRLWGQDIEARRVLALTIALARDPLLHLSQDFILAKHLGELVERSELEELLQRGTPGRFSPASLKSFAQNINGSWTQAGFLKGKVHKVRVQPTATPTNLAYALFLGYLEGLRAQRLFSSDWARLLSGSPDELVAMAQSASRRGLLVFMNAGGVMEVRFPGYLTPEEEGWLHE